MSPASWIRPTQLHVLDIGIVVRQIGPVQYEHAEYLPNEEGVR